MPLPDLIEILPLKKPVPAEITVPGSKSITNRALILAALAEGETTCFEVEVAEDPQEFCNRTIIVRGLGGKIPRGGTLESPLEIFVGNAGTAARFLTALVCLGNGIYRVQGVKRMHQRPQEALFDALRELGYCIDSVNDKLPATVHGTGPREGTCCVSIAESSQFASALLLCAKVGSWHVNVVGENAEESPYVAMTTQLIEKFPKGGGEFQIEPDASSGSYFVGAGWLLSLGDATQSSVCVTSWPTSGWQIDAVFSKTRVAFVQRISRRNDLGDSIMTAIALAPFEEGAGPQVFVDLERLRLQECDRVEAIRTELTRCGAKVVEEDDTLEVFPSRLHGAEIETYNDHRMAMCFAILGLKVSGIKIKNPACVKKSFPNFFQKLAAPPPHGLGATILDARTARALSHDELFAE
ncbi:MAG: hypothetical protein DME21_08330 [Verrucomicrobia bacterium]|nr:MAG: hypothetical protein DME21_08330 [Verrucomicrobiota bacterium]